MANVKELREQSANLVAEARAKLDSITDDVAEERAAEIESEVDAMLESAAKLDEKAERAFKLDQAQRRAEAYAEDVETGRRPVTGGEGRSEQEGPSYREAFHAYLRSVGEGTSLDPEVRAVLRTGYQKVEGRAQTVGTNSAGGFTVPEEMQNMLIRSMLAWGPMYSEDVATTITTSGGNPLPMPTVNDTAVTAGASTEGATLTDDGGKDVTFGQKQLDAYSFDTEWVRCSLELAQDSIFAMESLLADLLGERLGRIANLQLTTGSGSGAPNGIVTASTLGKTAAGAAAVTLDEVLDLEHSVDPAYRVGPKVGYMFNDSTLLALRKLKDGDGNYLWQQGNVQAGVPSRFNGRTYRINQAMASLGTGNKTILFGDFGKYYVRKVGAPIIGAIQDKDFWPGFGVAGYIRFDGELGDTAAVKHLIQA